MRPSRFHIEVPQETLDDLRVRLEKTRWPDEGGGWAHGMSLSYLQELVHYWLVSYDWREQEAAINRFEHFQCYVGGVNVHFVHARGRGKNPVPLVLTHGWPDSFHRFHKVLPLLTDGEDSFDVVVPSLPGYGFSERTTLPPAQVADLWAELMCKSLGYSRFFAAGGDLGSRVTMALAQRHPDKLAAAHYTDVGFPTGQEEPASLSEAEKELVGVLKGWMFSEGAYAMLQSTKPQTLAFALNDSPVGLASWLLSFVHTVAEGHRVDDAMGGRDSLLTNVMIYWVTQTAGSAARIYLHHQRESEQNPITRSEVPAGVAAFPRDAPLPREWAERQVNLAHYEAMPKGGHFAALEEPELFAQTLRDFFRPYRDEITRSEPSSTSSGPER